MLEAIRLDMSQMTGLPPHLLPNRSVVLEVALVAAEDHVGLVADGVDLQLTHPVGDVDETVIGINMG